MTNLSYENSRFLDIVNEDDIVVGAKSRSDIHKLGLLHRQVHVWMFDDNQNIFFQKRGLHRPSAGLLDATIGGHVNKGEDYLDAAVRETEEETGISVSPSDLVFLKKIRHNPSTSKKKTFGETINNFIEMVYIYKYPVSDTNLRKEKSIPGVGFKKVSPDFLLNPEKKYAEMFKKIVFAKEVPHVLKYIEKNTLS